ncbi:MAG: protein kinase [Planctomycetaceae bacterium]|jgi:eukaryotic-like serine/threonine-protein kinase|nr:protein kinase [Planctomycetaceae bacterium]MBT6484649.1 protein kinase [Planctomycetaceae bacterium]MBT6494827.1 protein kinase [Planctomycetaceae bacterium]
MADVTVQCPNSKCGKTYRISKTQVGRKSTCRNCEQVFTLTPAATVASGANKTLEAAKQSTTDSQTQLVGAVASATGPPHLGRYQIQERLGAGAFGAVFRAFDTQLDRQVALKVPQPATLGNQRAIERFLREAKASARLTHPNIVPVFDAGQDGDSYYFAAAFIDGHPLTDSIEEQPTDFRTSAEIVRKLAEGLHYAHSLGIVHRDIKPDNVMVDKAGEPHLMDFGLARIGHSEEKLTQDGSIMGTPAYMSPEQAAGHNEEVKAPSDQYSLGVVLYELISGHTPFEGPPAIVIYNILNEEIPSPRTINPAVPADLETICLKAMSRDADHRYRDCRQMADDLRRWLDDEPIRARRIGWTERATRWCRRNPLVAGLTGTVVAVILVALVLSISLAAYASTKERQAVAALGNEQNATRKAQKASELADMRKQEAVGALKKAESQQQLAQQREQEALRARNLASSEKKKADAQRQLALQAQQRAEDTADELRQALTLSKLGRYNVQLGLVWKLRETQPQEAAALLNDLEGCPPRHRDFIWSFLRENSPSNPAVLSQALESGRHANCTRTALTEDHSTVAVVHSPTRKEDPSEIRIWDVASEELQQTLKGLPSAIRCVAFSPSGRVLAVGGGISRMSSHLSLWDVETGKQQFALKGNKREVRSVAFSPDGKTLASAETGQIILWNTQSGKQIRSLAKTKRSGLGWLRFVGGGRMLISANPVSLWDVRTGKLVKRFGVKFGASISPAVSADGTTLATAGDISDVPDHEKMVQVWNLESGQEQARLAGPGGHRNDVRYLALSHDGKTLITAPKQEGSSGLLAWDATTGQSRGKLQGHEGRVVHMSFSKDGTTLATATFNGDQSIKLWRGRPDRARVAFREHEGPVFCVAFSPDGKLLASTSTFDVPSSMTGSGGNRGPDNTLRIWDLERKEQRHVIPQDRMATRTAFTPDGKTVCSTGNVDGFHTMRLWDPFSGQMKLAFGRWKRQTLAFAGFSTDGRTTISYASPAIKAVGILAWNTRTGKLQRDTGIKGRHRGMAVSPDARLVAIAGGKDVQIVDIGNSKKRIGLKIPGDLMCASFSQDNSRFAWVDIQQKVHLTDVKTGREIFVLEGHKPATNGTYNGSVSSITFSPNGKLLATTSDDRTIKLWDLSTGREVETLAAHTAAVNCAAFSPDGKLLASGSADRRIILWDVAAD